MARQCTQPKRPRNAEWFKEKEMLAKAHKSGQILDEEKLTILADPGIPNGQAAQTTIPNTAAFQTEDLDAYDSDCDDVSNAMSWPIFPTMDQTLSQRCLILNPIIMIWIIKKAQRIKPTLYDGSVISSQHVVIPTIDDEETLILEEAPKELPKDKSYDNQNALEILEYFENNDLKAQLQAKDTTICKLKVHIKSMRENNKEEKVKQEMDEIETINIELEHSMAKLLSENKFLLKEIEHLKKIYKDQFDSIKKTCALSKEHCDSLISQSNSKSMENADLKGKIQEKVFVTTTLQNELRRLKCKRVLDNATTITNATTIALGMFKLDIEPLSYRHKNNRDAQEDYLKKTIENTDTIHGLVERARKQNPSEPLVYSACKFTKYV
ncbi:hypothetical protein Tco_0153748 [Tanacetum coccineum]